MSSFILSQILLLEPPNNEGLHCEEQVQWPSSQAKPKVHPVHGAHSPKCPFRN